MTIKVENLTKEFDGRKVLDNISFNVEEGEILSIVGFSGSGKSTILKILCGLLKADSGNIDISDGDVAMVFQYSALFDSLNVFDNISFALQERKEFKNKYTQDELKEIVAKSLRTVGLSGIEDKFPHELSGGMQKRVSLARAIVTKPKFILYDEPTAGLDPIASTVIEDYILRLRDETKATSIIVTHQMSTIKRCSDRVIMLYDGHIVYRGTPSDLLKQNTPYTKQFVSASMDGPMKIAASGF
ncbi:TPA: ATP-binding cassette domain-containing protein [Candidatus Avigastranaerophilus faecigallinarum]|nr:ATP-binding cassette domain-containing protein [Candidatus Avigastranaerophilus faecigallinarum]